MAYGDGGNRFWQVDLTTRSGAMTAARTGSAGGFIMCGMAVLGAVLFGGMAGFTTPEGILASGGGLVEALIGLIAGLRFRAGKGFFWGIAAAVLMTLEILAKAAALSFGGVILSGVVLAALVTGIRGAAALRGKHKFEDEDVGVFS